jgi:eukaryotic-like serine/threonine-protein kinase
VLPVSSNVFAAYKALYAYDKSLPLDARAEKTEDLDWARRERVTVRGTSGSERLPIYVFLPRTGKPPYPTVLFFPGSNAVQTERLEDFASTLQTWMPETGRAFVFPVYRGTFERRGEIAGHESATAQRDDLVAWVKDASRAIDYAESRRDLDVSRLGYYGLSWGADVGSFVLAVDGRFKAAVLVGGGFGPSRGLPEGEAVNFAPRVKVPVEMINGRFDHSGPVEWSQRPMFEALGAPANEKSLVLYDSGHVPPFDEIVKQSISWFDRWLGPPAR